MTPLQLQHLLITFFLITDIQPILLPLWFLISIPTKLKQNLISQANYHWPLQLLGHHQPLQLDQSHHGQLLQQRELSLMHLLLSLQLLQQLDIFMPHSQIMTLPVALLMLGK
ncbi:unnamed protein product [Blepharisma stoltei]|uniref:Uncharacterized protein n=1 Tax=Blepharisma stoltei TaxID=1481888 RepID=A0AAU9IB12_9CILI|nr:unnamed protein product [Blepharisma stoltei]